MTVRELIQALYEYDPEMKVVVRGYENGFNDILLLKPVNIIKQKNPRSYDGEYIESQDKDSLSAIDLYGDNTSAS